MSQTRGFTIIFNKNMYIHLANLKITKESVNMFTKYYYITFLKRQKPCKFSKNTN